MWHPKLTTHRESWDLQLSNGTRVWGSRIESSWWNIRYRTGIVIVVSMVLEVLIKNIEVSELRDHHKFLRRCYDKSRVVYQFGIFGRYLVGISPVLPIPYRRKTRSVFSVWKIWQKIGGSPLFPKKGGHRPPLCTLHPFWRKKRNSRGIFQKQSSRENLKMRSRQSLQYNNTDRNTGKNCW